MYLKLLERPISKLDKVETGTLERLESSCKVIFNTCRLKNAHMADNSKLNRLCLSMLYFFINSPKIKRANALSFINLTKLPNTRPCCI